MRDGWSEGRLERSNSKSIITPSDKTNNLLLVASLIAGLLTSSSASRRPLGTNPAANAGINRICWCARWSRRPWIMSAEVGTEGSTTSALKSSKTRKTTFMSCSICWHGCTSLSSSCLSVYSSDVRPSTSERRASSASSLSRIRTSSSSLPTSPSS